MGERIVIVTGGTLGDWVLERIRPDDVLVGADRGALFLVQHGLRPAMALGDFDSVSVEERDRIRASSEAFRDCDPVLKDASDTEMAFVWALERQPDEILLLGALGSRFDHSLANVQLLRRAVERGIRCVLADSCNEIRLAAGELTLDRGPFDFVSLLPLTLQVTGVTLEGFQYSLHDATLELGQSLGISNAMTGPNARLSLRDGLLLVVQSKDAAS